MTYEEYMNAWAEVAAHSYGKIISGEMESISWKDVQAWHLYRNEMLEQAKREAIAIIDAQLMEDLAEQKYGEALDAEGNEPEPPKKFTIMTREFGEISVDEDTYYKYYAELKNL